MNKNIKNVVNSLANRTLRNNTQRTALTLLRADGAWVAASKIRVPNASSRARDLRQQAYGGFNVECTQVRSRSGKRTTTTYFRLEPGSVTTDRLSVLFKNVTANSSSTESNANRSTKTGGSKRVTKTTRRQSKTVSGT